MAAWTVGLAYGFARIGNRARLHDGDVAAFSSTFYPVRSAESLVQLTYRWTANPDALQPDFQYIINPGGGIANPMFWPEDQQRRRSGTEHDHSVLT
ncbi:MAG TPA: carbohydrate porin [Stellaceae bacterium]|jgi:porin